MSAVPKSRPLHPAPFLAQLNQVFGNGEMADLTRAFDWSRTSVGPIDQWPEALLTTVNTLLASRHPMFLWWGDDLVQFYNDGYRPSIREDKHPRALGQNGRDCWPEIWSIIGPQIHAVMATGQATWHENQLVPINRNGKLEDVYWTYGYSPVRDAAGSICGTLVVCTETTQSVLANNQLQQERQRLADLFQQAPAFFAVLNGPSHIFEMANPPYQELIGHRDILDRPLGEAVPESIEQGFVALLDTVYRTGEPYIGRNTPIELVRSASEPAELRFLDFVYQPRRDADGTISGIIVLGVDVTENRRVEQALLQSEKLAAVGRLASSIAHEINNPLEAVTNLLYLAQHSATKPEVREYLNIAEAELRRVSGIARQTLRFYRQSTNATPVAMPDLIGDTLPLYQGRLTNAGIHVERRDRSRLPVTCFEGEIRQVLSNLLGNAIDAIGSHAGRILVRSREATHWTSGRRGVVLTVADTGSGMSKTAQTKIFDAFFTTKGASGTGLGLWISRQIVDRHQGILSVRSSQSSHSRGTVFTLFLPAGEDLTA
ncbi:MAG TPA: ATP-binding protein [Acidobacteriaceae bacterium]